MLERKSHPWQLTQLVDRSPLERDARPLALQRDAAVSGDGGRRRAAVPPAARQSGARLLLAGVALGPVRPRPARRQRPGSALLTLDQCRRRSTGSPRSASSCCMFTIGLELSFERLRRMRRLVFGLGLAQVVRRRGADRAAPPCWLGLPPPAALVARRGAVAVLDRDRHPGAGREQAAAAGAGRAGLLRGAAVPGSGGRAAAVHGRRMLGGGGDAGWPGAAVDARAGGGWRWSALVVARPAACCGRCSTSSRARGEPEFFMAACLLVVLGDGAGRRREPACRWRSAR